ncbi:MULTISPECIES: hypothetical protein [unclassified Crossiella]|uniref:hypothetical protein n=1 Tax=unclassified Crossiella TaxID=2620835 RepID=UPI001FFE3B4D|nr:MULTISPECIES: hypothetical protein [unclassified Crossiella]MCK2236602.1 hypothetical protein [Crossiella sp. S99.2]MCK2250269.1 hypothetical protein [Crossiella sp. S99.1]
MAEIVLVHGIGQENKDQAELETAMVSALAAGLAAAGHPPLTATARLAYYADLFSRPGGQGGGIEAGTPEQEALFGKLLVDLLRHAAERGPEPADRRQAERALRQADADCAGAQGPRALVRPLLNAITRVSTFSRHGFSVAERFVRMPLWQVTQYFTDERIRTAVRARVAGLIGADTRVVIAHSLGTVVAYEALHQLGRPLPLLITLGSPLGLRTVIYERLRPQPARVPPGLARWVNILDPDDLIAARPDLDRLFPGAADVVEPHVLVDNGAEPHAAGAYLRQAETGRPVGQVLRPV